jgi:hypothetical protein
MRCTCYGQAPVEMNVLDFSLKNRNGIHTLRGSPKFVYYS